MARLRSLRAALFGATVVRILKRMSFVALAALAGSAAACDPSSLLGLLSNGITIVVDNQTDFTATVDLRRSASRNLVDDFLNDSSAVDGISAVGPNQVATFFITCNDEIETIGYWGAQFRDGGVSVGRADAAEILRRDSDYDCGGTIRIRLTGAILSFDSSLTAEKSPIAITTGGNADDDSSNDNIADLLDSIFGG